MNCMPFSDCLFGRMAGVVRVYAYASSPLKRSAGTVTPEPVILNSCATNISTVDIEILHRLRYVHMYYTTRLPIFLLYEVYIRPCRLSIINSMFFLHLVPCSGPLLDSGAFCSMSPPPFRMGVCWCPYIKEPYSLRPNLFDAISEDSYQTHHPPETYIQFSVHLGEESLFSNQQEYEVQTFFRRTKYQSQKNKFSRWTG